MWIESHDDVGDHKKTQQLCYSLNTAVPTAVGYLHLLWHYTARTSWQTGDLAGHSPKHIARACWWEGDADVFIKALQDSGYLDDMQVHDWQIYARELIYQRIYNKTKRAKIDNSCKKAVLTPVIQTNPTLPNPTLPLKPAPLKATAEFSEGFIKKADEAKTKGFNIYQLMNRFYKESKLAEKLPEAVFSAVLDEFNLRGEVVKDHWPYFIKVLENKSAVHFASRNIQEGEEFKKKPAFSIAQIMESMK